MIFPPETPRAWKITISYPISSSSSLQRWTQGVVTPNPVMPIAFFLWRAILGPSIIAHITAAACPRMYSVKKLMLWMSATELMSRMSCPCT